MKLISYNVNGIRAAVKKGFFEWLKEVDADVIGIQETKAHPEQVDSSPLTELGYKDYWVSAEKKGYSGVAIFSKKEPNHVEYGLGIEKFDFEGRAIRADYDNFSLLNVYMPSGTTGGIRQDFKYEWLDDFYEYVTELKKQIPNLIVCGDYNICHKAIDIHNPVSNKNSSGFLPEERSWMDKFFDSGFIDTFRAFNEEPHNYSWWSYRAGARGNNKGWRIDYLAATEAMRDRLSSASILSEVVHSDHCPIVLEID